MPSCIRKRAEHGLETWVFFLDLVKAFDTVPRSMLWRMLRKLGVNDKIVRILEDLHHTVHIHCDIGGIDKEIDSTIGVKQGDLLGPI